MFPFVSELNLTCYNFFIGRLFNKDGNLLKWWSNQSIAAFKQKTSCLKEQYSSYVFHGKNVSMISVAREGPRAAKKTEAQSALRALSVFQCCIVCEEVNTFFVILSQFHFENNDG